jgi:hypothetical protein
VWFAVCVTVDADVIWVPPLDAVNHPLNVNPLLDVVASVPYVEPFVTTLLVGLGVVPPLALNVTVIVTAAENTVVPLNTTVVIFVPLKFTAVNVVPLNVNGIIHS